MRRKNKTDKLLDDKAKKFIYCRTLSELLERLWKVDNLSSSTV